MSFNYSIYAQSWPCKRILLYCEGAQYLEPYMLLPISVFLHFFVVIKKKTETEIYYSLKSTLFTLTKFVYKTELRTYTLGSVVSNPDRFK